MLKIKLKKLAAFVFAIAMFAGSFNSAAVANIGDADIRDCLCAVVKQQDSVLPVTFEERSPMLMSDEELRVMIENVPNQNPLDTRSAIRLPNRAMIQTELAEWISEYNAMGGETAFELAVVREVNRVRESYRLNPLTLDTSLMLSARLKTQEFGDLQYFGHNSPVHGTATEAARMFGFEGSRVSETITRLGSRSNPVFRITPESVVRGMLDSTRGHRGILLNPNADTVGVGAFFSPESTGASGMMSHMFYVAVKFGIQN